MFIPSKNNIKIAHENSHNEGPRMATKKSPGLLDSSQLDVWGLSLEGVLEGWDHLHSKCLRMRIPYSGRCFHKKAPSSPFFVDRISKYSSLCSLIFFFSPLVWDSVEWLRSSPVVIIRWRFPKMEVPLNHAFQWDFPFWTAHFWISPFMETLILAYRCS